MTPVKTILVPVDFSEHSARALDVAVEFARSFRARVHLLHCYQINPGGLSPYGIVLPEGFDRQVREASSQRLREWREKLSASGVAGEDKVTPLFPSEAISAEAEEMGADLIVMGTRGLGGIKHVLLGSVAERTIRTAPCPVLTVKASDA